MRKKKPPYSKPQPLKLMKGKKKKLLNGKGHKGLITKSVKLTRSKRYGCARLRTVADYHREKRLKEAEDLMNVTTPAGCGALSARRSSSKQYKEAASIVDLDHCYVKVDEPSVYKTRVRIENEDRLKLTVVRTPEAASSTFVHSSGDDDNVDASGGSDTIPSPDRAATHMQETILEGASRLVTMLRQQMESGDDLSNLLPPTTQYGTETMSSDIHDVGIAGLDLMNDGGNIEQQLTDILDSMQQETSPGGAGSRHTKTTPDLDNLVQDNIDRDMQLQECDDVAENTTQGDVDGEGCGMDVDEIELGEADYQLWQESHNSGANIEVQDDSAELRDADSSSSVPVVAVEPSGVNEDAESSHGSVDDHRDAGDDGEHAASSDKEQQPCLVDHQYY